MQNMMKESHSKSPRFFILDKMGIEMFGPGSVKPNIAYFSGLTTRDQDVECYGGGSFINFGDVLTKRLRKEIISNFCLWRQLFGLAFFLFVEAHLVGILVETAWLHSLLHIFPPSPHCFLFALISLVLSNMSSLLLWCCDQCWQGAGLNCSSPNPAPWTERAPRSGGQLYSGRPRGTLIGKKNVARVTRPIQGPRM